jgi:hypothetical protein
MAQRRPLVAGVNAPENTDPEAVRAFIKQEPSKKEAKSELAIVAESGRQMPHAEDDSPEVELPKPAPKRKGKGRLPVGLIPVTVRLRPEIAGALKRASLERQLAGEDTYTQQDIVEQALEPWLRSEGFL